MKKIKINIDRPDLSGEDINAGKDFNRVYGQYTSIPKPWYKSIGIQLGSAVVAVSLVAVIGAHFFRTPAYKPFINEPVPGASEQFATYQIDAGRDTSFVYKTSSKLTIPADAFLYEDGKVAHGIIDIRYREFHDAVDIFLSGIPMNYDSGGVAGHLQSGGMLQFEASQFGRVLKPNPMHLINVDLASTAKGNFNLYYLDTMQRRWVYSDQTIKVTEVSPVMTVSSGTPVARDTTAVVSKYATAIDTAEVAKLKTQITALQDTISKIEKAEPIKPLKASDNKRQFTIDVDPKEFPEITAFKDVLFEPEDGQIVTNADYNLVWEDVLLKENKQGHDFQLELKKGDRKLVLMVVPVYDDENYPKAQKEFEKKYADYSATLKNRKVREERMAAEYRAEQQQQEDKQRHLAEVTQKLAAKLFRQDSLKMVSTGIRYQKEGLAQQRKQDAMDKKQAAMDKKQDAMLAKIEAKDKRQAAKDKSNGYSTAVGYVMQPFDTTEAIVYNSFYLLNFGVANCDKQLAVKCTGSMVAFYKNENNSNSNIIDAYLLLRDYNTCVQQSCYYSYMSTDYRVGYYPTECLLVAMDKAGAVFIYTPQQYSKLNAGVELHTFFMHDVKDRANLASELKKYLKNQATS